MSNRIIIAIDGTSSTGKSTLAKRISKKLNYIYIDSGAMYRALTFYAIKKKYISTSHFDKFKLIKIKPDENVVFTCGSGVTASVLALAYSLIDIKYMPTIYDGSWSEYGNN